MGKMLLQPRFQALFPLPPFVVGKKTQVAAVHVTKKNLLDGRGGRIFWWLLWETWWISVAKNYPL